MSAAVQVRERVIAGTHVRTAHCLQRCADRYGGRCLLAVPMNEGLTRLRSCGSGALCSLAAAARAMWAWMRADATLGHTPCCALVVAAIHALENSSPSADTHDSSLPAFIIVLLRNTEAASRHRPSLRSRPSQPVNPLTICLTTAVSLKESSYPFAISTAESDAQPKHALASRVSRC